MDKFLIGEEVKTTLEERIGRVVVKDLKFNVEIQDAGHSVFVRIFVMMDTTVKEILRMNDDIESILIEELPDRLNEPRWAQAYLIGGQIIYTNMGGFEM